MDINNDNDIKRLVEKISEQITLEKLNKIWKGFNITRFALYKENKGYLSSTCEDKSLVKEIEWNPQHYGNTCILYNNEYLGIWNLNTLSHNANFDRLFASIVHELFHGYQSVFCKKDYANELKAATYTFTKEVVKLMLMERQFLYQAVMETDNKLKQNYINSFIVCRSKRISLNREDILYDLTIESHEGTASFVEYKALKMISGNTKDHLVSFMWNKLYKPKDIIKHFRKGLYATGMFICLLLDEIAGDWQQEFQSTNILLYDLLLKYYCPKPSELLNENKDCAELIIKNYKQKQEDNFNMFKEQQGYTVNISGNIELRGYDPMNIVSRNNKILHKHFLMIKAGNQELVLKGVIICEHNTNFAKIKKVSFKMKNEPKQQNDKVLLSELGEIKAFLQKENNIYNIIV